jgi:hypothetical protein
MHSYKDFTTPVLMHILTRRFMIRDDLGMKARVKLESW